MTLPFGPSLRNGGTDVAPPAPGSKRYQAQLDFWIAPFILLRKGNVFYYEQDRVVHMPCGYDEASDMEATVKLEEIEELLRTRWIVEIGEDGEPLGLTGIRGWLRSLL